MDIAIGRKPKISVDAVSNIGLILRNVPFLIMSTNFNLPSFFNSLKLLINTNPFNTATPNKTINPIPADILKGISLRYSENIPPTAAKGIAIYIISVCFTDFTAKNTNKNIKINAKGTTNESLLDARSRFSKAPPYLI